MISASSSGSTDGLESFLKRMTEDRIYQALNRYGEVGVVALRDATPVESSETANSWTYKIRKSKGRYSITWYNSHVENGVNIAVILQYGHATRGGGWVEGRDYINPALRPIFEKMTNDFWKEVTRNG